MAKTTKNKSPKSDVRDEMGGRVQKLYAVFVLLALIIVVRLVWVVAISPEVDFNTERIKNRIFRESTVYARRGSVLSRHGDPMAISIMRYKVEFDMASEGFDSEDIFEEQVDSLSKLLAIYFGGRPEHYAKKFFDGRRNRFKVVDTGKDEWVYDEDAGFVKMLWDRLWGNKVKMRIYDTIRNHLPIVVLPRNIDYSEWQTLRTYPILNQNMGVTYTLAPVDSRAYPYGELGRRTLGMIGDRGDYGIEYAYREELEGKNGSVVRQRIAPGYSRTVHRSTNVDAEDGKDVVTTLDPELQHIADLALRQHLTERNATWGTTIVMEVATGDILAMVNLNETVPESGVYVEGQNFAIGRAMEPGSTYKLAATLALLEEAKMSPAKTYDTNYGEPVQVGGTRGPWIIDDHSAGGKIDLKTAFAESSNVYFTSAIYDHYKDAPERYVNFLRGLHLDKTMGLERLAEVKPYIPTPTKPYTRLWSYRTLIDLGFGYATSLAPIHTLTLYNAIANDGCMVAPRLVTAIRQGDEVVEEFPVRVLVDKVCSDENLAIIRDCMAEVARTGTGERFFGDTLKYSVAAKTGTAQVNDGKNVKHKDGHYLGSMALFFPLDKPKYTMITAVYSERRRNQLYHGANASAPVLRQIVDYLTYRDGGWRESDSFSGDGTARPSGYKGGNTNQVATSAANSGVNLLSTPLMEWGRPHVEGGKLHFEALGEADRMPNVVGMGLKDALYILESRGLEVSFSGVGAVASQSIGEGAPIRRGTKVTITLK